MKNLTQYIIPISKIFFEYLHENITEEKLLKKLKSVERTHKKKKYECFWFRFHNDDTGATTIEELCTDLRKYSINREYRLNQLKDCISLGGELRVFCS